MDFVDGLGDCASVPTFSVGGVARAEIIDGCLVRLTFYAPHAEGEAGHLPEVQLLWTVPSWLAARFILHEVAVQVAKLGLQPAALPVLTQDVQRH